VIELYQFAICPFCNQTKALLAYTNSTYTAIEVNPLTNAELKWYVRLTGTIYGRSVDGWLAHIENKNDS
jgi:glutaredoxin